jgi:hypothetical protein
VLLAVKNLVCLLSVLCFRWSLDLAWFPGVGGDANVACPRCW